MVYPSKKKSWAGHLSLYIRHILHADRILLARRALLLVCDTFVIIISFWLAFALRLNQVWPTPLQDSFILLPWLLVIGLCILVFTGWYKSLTRSTGSHSLYGLVPRTVFILLGLLLIGTLYRSVDPPRSFWLLLWVLMTTGLVLSRVFARDLLRLRFRFSDESKSKIPTLIYGAGEAGHRLLQDLRNSSEFHLVGFIDDDSTLWKRRLARLPIYPPTSISELKQQFSVQQILLALPSASLARRRQLFSELRAIGFSVYSIPSLTDIASGRKRVSELRSVSIEDLLGRQPSTPLPGLLERAVTGKSVLVTGAGGSIGSELCRQVLSLECSTIVLFERSEYSLYTIYQELSCKHPHGIIIPVLGDSANQLHLEHVCTTYKVDLFLHAAAYKHVPLVEANLCSAVANNVYSTCAAISAARKCNVKHFTLISSDKAVRPTNVMGASKRACELLVQAAAARPKSRNSTTFSMVRFGNVLGSSGSVVPLFRTQIANGGPVTVTHPQITRYFMTIPEAVQLVLQSSAMAQGGEVFVLDMGEPVQVAELARQMIYLSGLSLKDKSNPTGDIAIEFTGLRPGEKLFEELLLNDQDAPTNHPLIRQAKEAFVPDSELRPLLDKLLLHASEFNKEQVIQSLQDLVPEFFYQDISSTGN